MGSALSPELTPRDFSGGFCLGGHWLRLATVAEQGARLQAHLAVRFNVQEILE